MHTSTQTQSPLLLALASIIDATKIDGQYWPDDAMFCVSVRQRTWPLYSGDYHAHFFQTQAQLDEFLASQHAWERLEDNYLDYKLYEWEFGPKLVKTH